ncbi:MAG: hypothetical protein SFY69_02970 [Planctomycetota bacterium]|nr:hypothetical protein [Planctomycetota bacterium]
MNSRDGRSFLARRSNPVVRERRRARSLAARVGRALGLSEQRPEAAGVDSLEARTMLEGSFATAILVNLDGGGRGTSAGVINPAQAPTDNDYYRFVAPASDFVRILADTANESPASTLNTRVTVFDSTFTQVASGTNNGILTTGLATDGWAGFHATSGETYYVVVSSDYAGPAPNLTTGNTFTLRISALSNTFATVPAAWSATAEGVAIDPATPPPAPLSIWPVGGSLGVRQDDQVWTYTAAQTSLVTLNAQHNRYNRPFLPGSTIPDRLDTRLDVYDSEGVLLNADSDAGRINDAFTTFLAEQGETYFIRVRSDEIRPRNAGDPAFDVTLATGDFWLVADTVVETITLNSVTRRGSDTGAFVATTAPNVPPPIPRPTFQTHSYGFEASGDGLAIITVTPTGLAPVTDPAVRLFDDAGNLVAYNDNFAGLAAQLQVSLVGGELYYVVVDGFEINSATQYIINVEANVTNAAGDDDHINSPVLGANPTPEQRDAARRIAMLATGLTFSGPTPVLDANQNHIRDRGVRAIASATGRIYDANGSASDDTDLFQFTAPTDMLIDYAGNNDDQGTSLFVGGAFQAGSNNTPWLTTSRTLTTWDAADWWYTGAQFFDQANNVTYGFNDNPDTAGTTRAEIYALHDYDPGTPGTVPTGMSRRWLVVGGDFDLVVPGLLGPVTFKNLAVWIQDFTTGQWGWASLGDVDGPVRALASFIPEETVPGLNDPGLDVDTNRPEIATNAVPYLAVGGEFTTVDGNAAANLATFDVVNGWLPFGAGTDGPVYALTVYDPADAGEERAGQPGPPPVPQVNDSRDIPPSLFIGGDFSTIDGLAVQNLAYYDGAFIDMVWGGPAAGVRTNAGPNGPVRALTTYAGWDPDGAVGQIEAPDTVLIIGGEFTSIADGEGGNTPAANLAAWGFLGAAAGGSRDTQLANFNPRLTWEQVDAGITAPNANGDPVGVYALTTWDPPDINNTTIDPVLVAGGAFNAGGLDNLVAFAVDPATDAPIGFGWFNASVGTNGIVRTLTTLTDAQEPGIEAEDLNSGDPQQVLYVGGEFTEVTNGDLNDPVLAANVAQFSAFHDDFTGQDFFYFTSLAGGVVNTDQTIPPTAVYALSGFDDGNPLDWDRHDRPATRMAISVSPASGSFANMRVRVYDSNFNIVYGFGRPGSETIAPPFPDPAGMIDPSLAAPGLDTQLAGITLWGGETYYIEVSSLGGGDDTTTTDRGGTGRYTLSVIVDAMPEDLNGDGVRDDLNARVSEETDEGNFTSALTITLPLGIGDNTNYRNSAAQPLKGNIARVQQVNPSTGNSFNSRGDVGTISEIDDTDLYSFRAQFTGFAEIRLSTSTMTDEYGEAYGTAFRGLAKQTFNMFDGALRVFRNDFEQIAYSDDNAAITSDFQDVQFGAVGVFRFTSRDPRVVVPVIAGNTYFVQVESGARFDDGSSADPNARVERIARELDIRQTTGGYQLLINAMPNQINDIENGQTVFDDHANFSGAGQNLATPIGIGDLSSGSANGTASFSGIINDTPFNNPDDQDLFTFIAPGSGTMRIDVTRATGSTLNPAVLLFRTADLNNPVATGVPISGGGSRIDFDVQKGEEFYLLIAGEGGTEGGYNVAITGVPEVDDYADFAKLEDAQTIILRDFLGLGQISGSIEEAGDTDLFRFSFEDFYSSLTIDVTALDPTLDPVVSVYEVSEDPNANPMLLRIANNDNFATGSTTARVTFPITPGREKAPQGGPVRPYPYYYVVVQGANPAADRGAYTVTFNFPGTDDHPDAQPEDAPTPTTVDTGEFSFATRVVVDTGTGLGNATGSIERIGDSDLFQFTAPAGGPFQVVVGRPGSSTLRTRVFVTDSAGTVIASGTGQDSLFITTSSATGTAVRNTTYFISVQGYEDTGTPNTVTTVTGDYSLSVIAPPIDDHPNAGEFTLATGMIFNTVTGVAQVGGSTPNDPLNPRLSPTNDTDLFTFVAIQTGEQQIVITPFLAGGSIAPRLTVFNASGVQVGEVAASAALQSVSFTVTAAAGTRFYILVSAVTGIPGGTLAGEYSVQVNGPVPPGGGGDDPAEIDFNAPLTVSLDPRTGDAGRFDQISPSGDRDLFTFVTTAAGRVFVQVITPLGSLLDASVRVVNAVPVDSNGNGRFDDDELGAVTVANGFDADGVPGVTASVTFTGSANTRYWVIVDGLGESVGSYEVQVNTQPLTNRVFFPEGFANTNIREFLSIINPNSAAANYTVYIRYEWGQLETIISSGVVQPNSRDGLTLIDGPFYQTPGLILDTPYSIILESDLPLGATLAHYDFGSAVGDSFTETLSATWNFARVERNPGTARDFIVFYNPNPFDINVTLTASQNGQSISVTQRFEGLRRGGFSIDQLTQFPLGTFGLTVTAAAANPSDQGAFEGIVASLSHYSISGDAAYSVLGTPVTADNPQGAALRGVITNIAQGSTVSSEVVFFNPGSTTATVSLTGSYIRLNLPSFTRTIDIAPRSQVVLSAATLGLVADQPVGLRWVSSVPINALGGQTQFGDGEATQPATVAARQFYFGDAYINVEDAGQLFFETLFFHNPTALTNTVSIRLVFVDGSESTFTQTIAPRGFAEVKLHERPEIVQQRAGRQWFAVDTSAPLPFIATMQHYDLFLGGGWATSGLPFGITTSLNRIP